MEKKFLDIKYLEKWLRKWINSNWLFKNFNEKLFYFSLSENFIFEKYKSCGFKNNFIFIIMGLRIFINKILINS